MAIVLRYVDKKGFVVEAFIGLVHVKDTSALSLKKIIVNVLDKHSLSLFYVRGQCYDGASNMQGDINGLKMLIKKESKSAHSIHCFAHQLQLTLVAVSKKCVQVGELVLLVSNILNVLGASFKRMDELRQSQKDNLQNALDMDEIETGRGLNQELGLIRADANTLDERAKASGYLRSFQTYEVAFMLHLMKDILGITYDLNISLQKREQDIANAMILVEVAKKRLQKLRDDGWEPLINKISMFCIKHDILIPNFDEPYSNSGRSRRKIVDHTVLHHFHVEVFYKIIDWQLQELNDRFNELTSDLFHGVACLNPVNSFSSFDIEKIMRRTELYPDDFDQFSMGVLQNQLANYIIDVRDTDKRFSDLGGLGELSRKLVETKKNLTYPLIFRLVKFALLLSVATATVERAFSAMKYIKNDLRNRMDDEFLDVRVPLSQKKEYANRYRYQAELLFLAPEEIGIGRVAFNPVFLPFGW
ncbi:zinc finger MYM-type protein 1-like [Solanum tuberosum]|uniref:zinc finger MYM-type protein 1-like n=1 Tax=Solanum tuberosum TaxID=4113 RepID=UPI00073A1B59|nr:PREDICTED: zinc finger MYM-type protein 1-like [Solanum tuberosum]